MRQGYRKLGKLAFAPAFGALIQRRLLAGEGDGLVGGTGLDIPVSSLETALRQPGDLHDGTLVRARSGIVLSTPF